MLESVRMSRVVLAIGLGLAVTACTSVSKPISKSYGVATKANNQAQIVPLDPATIEQGPVASSADRAAGAREAYESGQVSDSLSKPESTGGK